MAAMTIAPSAGCGMPRKSGVNKISVRKQKSAAMRLASWVRAPADIATEVLDRLPTTRNPPKRPLRMLAGPVRDQLLVGIDGAAALHGCRLCPAERLGIADQHDGERAGREILQDRKVERGQARGEAGRTGGRRPR